jgi:hypothetical protein
VRFIDFIKLIASHWKVLIAVAIFSFWELFNLIQPQMVNGVLNTVRMRTDGWSKSAIYLYPV